MRAKMIQEAELKRMKNLLYKKINLLSKEKKMLHDQIMFLRHEIRAPLTSILAISEMLQKSSLSIDKQKEFVSLLQVESKRMIEIFKSYLNDSDIKLNDYVYTFSLKNVVDVVKSARKSLQIVENSHTIEIVDPKASFLVRVDELKLIRVVINIFTNAMKYSPVGGRICVAFKKEEESVIISIQDEGIGIASEELDSIFDRYYRASAVKKHFPGEGVGLYLSRQIIEAHNGEIFVESTVGEGSTFKIRLPLHTI